MLGAHAVMDAVGGKPGRHAGGCPSRPSWADTNPSGCLRQPDRQGSYHCVAKVAACSYKDCISAESLTSSMCCNTFLFDTCNMFMLSGRYDGESLSEDGSPRFYIYLLSIRRRTRAGMLIERRKAISSCWSGLMRSFGFLTSTSRKKETPSCWRFLANRNRSGVPNFPVRSGERWRRRI